MNRPESRAWNEQSRRWTLAAQIADRLADDRDLAEDFERTPGEVKLGVTSRVAAAQALSTN